MPCGSSLARRGALLIAIIPALLGSQVRCVAVSNPTIATARIDRIEPIMPRVGEVVHTTGSGNGTPPLQFAWDFGDGTLAGGTQAAHAYIAPGTYRVTLIVRDASDNAGSDAARVTVTGLIPTPVLRVVLASEAVAGQPVLFTASPLEERSSAMRYAWTFSGGQSAIGPRAAATFPVAGMYLATVTVTNDLGESAVAAVSFHVDEAH